MSEHVFGRWKMRFPILRQMRHSLRTSQKIIIATAVLFNMSKIHGLDLSEEIDDHDGGEDGYVDVHRVGLDVPPRQQNRAHIRAAGQRLRDQLRLRMPVP